MVRELGLERRETVRSLSGVGVRYLKGIFPQYERTGKDKPLVFQLFCQGQWLGSYVWKG